MGRKGRNTTIALRELIINQSCKRKNIHRNCIFKFRISYISDCIVGPKQCNVFEISTITKPKFSQEAHNGCMRVQDKNLKLLSETVSRPYDRVKEEDFRRCIDEASASSMETLIDDVQRMDLKLELPKENDLTESKRNSVMLGEKSLHHDYYDSKMAIETTPSYNQLNYNEKLQRFFNSKPITTPLAKGSLKMEDSSSANSPVHCFNSVTNTSNADTSTSSGSVTLVTLTETLLNKHNDKMEKSMLKKRIHSNHESSWEQSSLGESRSRLNEKTKKMRE